MGGFFCVYGGGAQKTNGYHLIDKIEVGGDGGWDGLVADAENHRLYVSHATHVVVIDTATDKVVGDIPNTNGVHCIVLAEKLGKGYTTNGRDNTVTVFDLKTLKVLGTVATGKNPDATAYDPSTHRVFIFNGAGAMTRRSSMPRPTKWWARWISAESPNLGPRMARARSL